MPTEMSTVKITANVFPNQPTDKLFRKTICEYHEYVEHVVGEYVLECAASCRDRRNVSVRIGENGEWRDFSVCDHHADVIEQKLGIIEGGEEASWRELEAASDDG